MFKNPFKLDGRINRTEYLISFIVFLMFIYSVPEIIESYKEWSILELLYIPLFWFIIAQGSKRCHDIGKAGCYQIIPFFVLTMLFTTSDKGSNEYDIKSKDLINIERDEEVA